MFNARVLIIEDEEEVASAMQSILLSENKYVFDVKIAKDGETGLSVALRWKPDVVLLDLGLPKVHGMTILRRVHQELKDTKVCVVTGSGGFENRLISFDEGSDDYISKPFSAQELLARVQALLRRGRVLDGVVLVHGDVCLEIPTRTVTRGDRRFRLTKKEYDLLLYLMQRPNQIISRDELLSNIWQDKDIFPNTVDAHIESLRQKVDKGFERRYIKTAYREGYYFDTLSSS